MSVIVRGMEMPETCMKFADGEQELCPFVNTDDDCILQDKCYGSWEEMHATCPLIEIPTPHGRLVDLDKMVDEYWDGSSMRIDKTDIKEIEEYDVLVEAEGKQRHD